MLCVFNYPPENPAGRGVGGWGGDMAYALISPALRVEAEASQGRDPTTGEVQPLTSR